MVKSRVFFLGKEDEFLKAMRFAFTQDFFMRTSSDPEDAKNHLKREKYDLVVLDYDLENAWADRILETLNCEVSVLVLIESLNKEAAVRLLNRRVQGVLEKPLTPETLAKKISSILGQTGKGNHQNFLSLSLSVIRDRRKIILQNGESLTLTPTEFKILDLLLGAQGQQITKDELCQKVWGNLVLSKNILDTHLSNLKKKVPILNEKLMSLYGGGIFLDM